MIEKMKKKMLKEKQSNKGNQFLKVQCLLWPHPKLDFLLVGFLVLISVAFSAVSV